MRESEFKPDYTAPPGATLEEILEDRGMSRAELAERMGSTRVHIDEIVRGEAPLTSETALGLERALGIPARFWSTREQRYREALARMEKTHPVTT